MAEHLPGGQSIGRPLQWYSKSLRDDRGWWVVGYEGVGDARGSVSVTVRQEGCDAAPELVLALLRLGVRPSRVDLAGDVHGAVARPRWYFDRRSLALTRTDVGRWLYREDGNGDSSLTVGSRSSERHMRIYDKALPDGSPRVRHELELKGGLAAAVGAALLAGVSAEVLWHEQYGRLVRWG